MSSILHASAPSVQPDLDIDHISEADRRWWASITRSEWWLDLATETVADSYGDPDGWPDDPDDDAIIDRFLANHGYEPPPPDEFFMWGGYPT